MQISEERIDQYIAIYLEEYGKPIERVQARDELTALICLMEAVYKFNNRHNMCCPTCKKAVSLEEFKDQLSEEEFRISGLCQSCQDLTFKHGER